MKASLGPFITCFLIILLLALYVCYSIYIRKDTPYGSIKFTFAVLVLILLRMMLPFNFPFTVNIVSYSLLPPLSRALYHYIGNLRFGFAEILLAGWVAGVIVSLVRFFYRQWRYHRWLMPFYVRDLKKYPRLEELIRIYGDEKIRICIIPMHIAPCIINPIRPVLILPQDVLEDGNLDYICQHELEHYRNFDLWLKLLLELVLCAQWFNPVAYFFRDKLTLVFELANDEKVVADKNEEERLNYMDCLLRLADNRRKQDMLCQGLSFFSYRESDLSVRIKRLLNQRTVRNGKHRVLIYLQYVFVVFLLVCSFVFVPEAYQSVEAESEGSKALARENAYFIKTEQGFRLYVEDEYWITLTHIPEELTDLVILEEEDVQDEKENQTASMRCINDGNDGSNISDVSGGGAGNRDGDGSGNRGIGTRRRDQKAGGC